MPEKDYQEKKFEDFNDVFADIINVLLFHGARRVQEEALINGMARSAFKVNGTFEEQERDTKKYWMNGQIRLAVYGLENQTGTDPDFVFRCIGYDGAEYRDQVRRRNAIRRKNAKRKKKLSLPPFYPVVTVVLYFGESRWTGSLWLKDHLNMPEGLDEFIPDYKVNLCEVAYLTDEEVGMFQSDFRYVAEYFTESRKRKEGLQTELTFCSVEHLRHVEEFVDLMNALTNSERFTQLPMLAKERGDETMWTILFDEAEERGIAIGEERGEIKASIRLYYNEMHLDPSEIVSKIMNGFSLSRQEAETYVESTLQLQKV